LLISEEFRILNSCSFLIAFSTSNSLIVLLERDSAKSPASFNKYIPDLISFSSNVFLDILSRKFLLITLG
jgi:hypothetical protein